MKGDNSVSQPIMNKVEREAMVEEIDMKSKSREEAMMNEVAQKEEAMMNEVAQKEEAMMNLLRELKEDKDKSQSELKTLHFELAAVTLACV
eukprot:15339830-Ditylum_brightwellii.AAC.1